MTPHELIAKYAMETGQPAALLCAPIQRKRHVSHIRHDIIRDGAVKYNMSITDLAAALKMTQGSVSKILLTHGISKRKMQQEAKKKEPAPEPKQKRIERYWNCAEYEKCLDKYWDDPQGAVNFNCVGCAKLEKREAI